MRCQSFREREEVGDRESEKSKGTKDQVEKTNR